MGAHGDGAAGTVAPRISQIEPAVATATYTAASGDLAGIGAAFVIVVAYDPHSHWTGTLHHRDDPHSGGDLLCYFVKLASFRRIMAFVRKKVLLGRIFCVKIPS